MSEGDGGLSSGLSSGLWPAYWQTVVRRRSVRGFSSKPVPREAIQRLIEAASLAASSANAQPWHFYVVTDPETRAKLVATTYPGPDCRSDKTQAWMAQAPAIIVVCLDWPRGAAKYNFESRYCSGLQDVSSAIVTILLGAAAMDLGACWVGGFRFLEVAQLLGIPPVHEPTALIPVGYPNRVPGDRKIRSLGEVLTWIESGDRARGTPDID